MTSHEVSGGVNGAYQRLQQAARNGHG